MCKITTLFLDSNCNTLIAQSTVFEAFNALRRFVVQLNVDLKLLLLLVHNSLFNVVKMFV
jgi:hypothetical protein